MMTNFIKYPSIENSYRGKFIDLIRMERFDKTDPTWYVTEKIHGANFSFWVYPDGTIKCAKRSGFIKEDESFFDYKSVLEKYEDRLKSLVHPHLPVVIFGELYGNGVQKEVDYGIDFKDFIAFDYAFITEDGLEYIDFNKALTIFETAKIPSVPVLFKGSFDDCLTYENEYLSTLNPVEGNVSEGNVIRPNSTLFLESDNRVILKNKNDKFKEREHSNGKKSEAPPLDPSVFNLIESMKTYINANRVDSAISKIGNDIKLFGDLLKEIHRDVVEEFDKECIDKGITNLYTNLDKDTQKRVNKVLNSCVVPLLKERL